MSSIYDRLIQESPVDPVIVYNTEGNAFAKANAAFDSSNTKLSLSGGTITGNLRVLGNTTVNSSITMANGNTVLATISSDANTITLSKNTLVDGIITLKTYGNTANLPISNTSNGSLAYVGGTDREFYMYVNSGWRLFESYVTTNVILNNGFGYPNQSQTLLLDKPFAIRYFWHQNYTGKPSIWQYPDGDSGLISNLGSYVGTYSSTGQGYFIGDTNTIFSFNNRHFKTANFVLDNIVWGVNTDDGAQFYYTFVVDGVTTFTSGTYSYGGSVSATQWADSQLFSMFYRRGTNLAQSFSVLPGQTFEIKVFGRIPVGSSQYEGMSISSYKVSMTNYT